MKQWGIERKNVRAGSAVISSSSTYSNSFFPSTLAPACIHLQHITIAIVQVELCFLCSIDFFSPLLRQTVFLAVLSKSTCYRKLVLCIMFLLIILTTANFHHPTCGVSRPKKNRWRQEHHCKTSISSVCVVKCVNESCVCHVREDV